MSTKHVVRQGETVAAIAHQHGFASWRTIWDHAENRELVGKRKNPDVLAPRDVLMIPDKVERKVSIATGKRHVFKVDTSPSIKLRLVLRDFDHKPLQNARVTLSIEGDNHELVTDGEGALEAKVPATARSAELRFQDPAVPFELTIPIEIGHLDPVDTVTGQLARLNNLGYAAGSVDDDDSTRFPYAVQEFQVDHGLVVDGICGPRTQAKLEVVHGS